MLKISFSNQFIEAGLDEVGRGCLAGPVVASAVILPINYREEELNDSKQLSKNQRERLAIEIKKNAIAWSIAEVSPTEIDKLNIANASFKAMGKALKKLHVIPELLLIDGNRFKSSSSIPYECIIKGDGIYASIAAASILAKVHRDEIMKKLSNKFPSYGWEKNVGYPTSFHREAIRKHGITPHHRLSFKLLSSDSVINQESYN